MWGATDVGRVRKVNEDSFLLAPDHGFVAVADGMGGYQRGDVAAEGTLRIKFHLCAEGKNMRDRAPSAIRLYRTVNDLSQGQSAYT